MTKQLPKYFQEYLDEKFDHTNERIEVVDAKEAIRKTDEVNIRSSDDLEDEIKTILTIIKNNSGKKMGDLFKLYQEKGGTQAYKTFQTSRHAGSSKTCFFFLALSLYFIAKTIWDR